MAIAADESELLAIFLETLLYGVFLTLYVTIVVLLRRRSYDAAYARQQRFVIPVASLMMLLATSHLILDFIRVLQAFIFDIHTTEGGASGYYANIAHPLNVAKNVLYVLQTTLGDGVLVWRLYVVHGKKIWNTSPFIVILLVNLAVGCIVCWSLAQATVGSTVFETAHNWITTFFALTMCINVICTAALVRQVWSTKLGQAGAGNGSYSTVVAIIIESGLIYTASVLALLISYLSGSQGQNAALDAVQPIVGIIFILLILQIRLHFEERQGVNSTTSSRRIRAAHNSRYVTPLPTSSITDNAAYTMQPISINIAQETEVDYGKRRHLKDDKNADFIDAV